MMTVELNVSRLRILVVDDDPISRGLVARYLAKRFDVSTACDGADALRRFEAHRPDLVVLDVQMPDMHGGAVASMMRQLAGDRFVSILMLSAHEEVSIMVDALSQGADDFMPKPFNPRIFDSKLQVILRTRELRACMERQVQELAEFQRETREQHSLANEVFARVLARGADEPSVRFSVSPMALFNGDVVLSARTPKGAMRLMLADVTGHGLSGAIGTIPLSTLFHRQTKDGLSLSDLLISMNEELRAILPTRLFCAAVALELNAERTRLTVCNAGMPDVHVMRGDDLVAMPSTNVPLAVLDSFVPRYEHLDVLSGDRIFAISDGVTECCNPAGELFGVNRLRALLQHVGPEKSFDALLAEISAFTTERRADDVTVAELRV